MPDVKKIATRVSYGQELAELGAEYDNICVMDADLAASTQTAIFGKRFPERFFDVGIQEGNMMGIAAGLASTGKVVFASSFAMFATGRAYEVIRNSIAYPKLNVKICASHAGVSPQFHRLSETECQDLRISCRRIGRRGWSVSSVYRGYCAHARHSEYDCHSAGG